MDHLNSVVIEGILEHGAMRQVDVEGETFRTYLLVSSRHCMSVYGLVKEIYSFEILVREALVKPIERKGSVGHLLGRCVRVSGRLKKCLSFDSDKTYILAARIEFCCELKPAGGSNE